MIRVLDKKVADKIAAGEVVERPLSIVKELVENSIDAGADSIVIEIKNGGKSYIRVTDNGCGIVPGEAKTAFMRHATSKIFTDCDLEHIETLGFRGEALASIAAVARCELITKTVNDKAGIRLLIEGSEIMESGPFGCPDGTTIIVSDLFFNTPARNKFMKSDASESSRIIDFVSKIAVAYPFIKFRFVNNDNILFSTRGEGDVLNSIITVYGGEIGRNLIPIGKSEVSYSIGGFVSIQGYGKSNRKTQVFFVNGRNISSVIMEKGVSCAYSDKMTGGRYPVCFLFFKLPAEMLDVNIHPNKREVRFDDEGEVAYFIERAIKEALLSKDAAPEVKLKSAEPKKSSENFKITEQVDIKSLLSTMRMEEEQQAYIKPANSSYVDENPINKPFDIRDLTVTGLIFSTYITLLDESAFYLIDQHAAHERVYYEKLLKQYSNTEKSQQILMIPLIKDVSYSDKTDSAKWIDALKKIGFDISEFGAKSFIVKAIPVFMRMEESERFIEHFIDSINETDDFEDPAAMSRITARACKSAIKAGDSLAEEEIKQLIYDLAECENPYNCPHGRPTFIKLTKDEIEKMFKRK